MQVADRQTMQEMLISARVIAVVGHSDRPTRTSYQIGRLLKKLGYTVYPVNPTVDEIDGERCYPSLGDVPEPIDIVNVFRRSEYLPGVVEEAIQVGAKAVWAQLGVVHDKAARLAAEAGVPLVMDRCIKVEYQRLGIGDLRKIQGS